MRHVLLVLTLAAIAAGCSRRDRANPLDPANPETGGRPQGFNAIAGYDAVTLSWTPQPQLAIDGFQLERRQGGDSLYRPLGGVLPPSSSAFLDSGEPNGTTVSYRLYYVVRGTTTRLPAEDYATPGALRPWVVEFAGAHLTRLSPDGRDVAFRVDGVGQVKSLAISPTSGNVWCSAPLEGWLTQLDPGGLRQVQLTGLQAPYSLAVSRLDQSVWVCDQSGELQHYGSDGSPRPPGRIQFLVDPQSVAVSLRDYSLWVCEHGADRVDHYSSSGAGLGATPVSQPSRVTVDSLSGLTWVSSYESGRIWRIAGNGALIDSTSVASGPIGIAIDRGHARAWIADTRSDRVLALDPSTLGVVFSVTGLSGAWDVAVDPASGDAWVTVRGQGAVVRLAASDGRVLERCGGLQDPREVRLDPGI